MNSYGKSTCRFYIEKMAPSRVHEPKPAVHRLCTVMLCLLSSRKCGKDVRQFTTLLYMDHGE